MFWVKSSKGIWATFLAFLELALERCFYAPNFMFSFPDFLFNFEQFSFTNNFCSIRTFFELDSMLKRTTTKLLWGSLSVFCGQKGYMYFTCMWIMNRPRIPRCNKNCKKILGTVTTVWFSLKDLPYHFPDS